MSDLLSQLPHALLLLIAAEGPELSLASAALYGELRREPEVRVAIASCALQRDLAPARHEEDGRRELVSFRILRELQQLYEAWPTPFRRACYRQIFSVGSDLRTAKRLLHFCTHELAMLPTEEYMRRWIHRLHLQPETVSLEHMLERCERATSTCTVVLSRNERRLLLPLLFGNLCGALVQLPGEEARRQWTPRAAYLAVATHPTAFVRALAAVVHDAPAWGAGQAALTEGELRAGIRSAIELVEPSFHQPHHGLFCACFQALKSSMPGVWQWSTDADALRRVVPQLRDNFRISTKEVIVHILDVATHGNHLDGARSAEQRRAQHRQAHRRAHHRLDAWARGHRCCESSDCTGG